MNHAGIYTLIAGCSMLLISLLIHGCGDETSIRPGLQNSSDLCFSIIGGNISNKLVANEDWAIGFAQSDDEWVTSSKQQGSGTDNPIDIFFIAKANNNPDSRTAIAIVTIGKNQYRYQLFQSGTNETICPN